jgi:hypothetical protein
VGDEGSGGDEGEAERGFVGLQPHEDGTRGRDVRTGQETGMGLDILADAELASLMALWHQNIALPL